MVTRPTRPRKAPGRIYVVRDLRHLKNLAPGDVSWWCVEQSADPGEICVMYVKTKGFALMLRYIGPAKKCETFCQFNGMATGQVEIIAKRAEPFTFQKMREHRVLRSLPAIRRSFQRRSFPLDEPFLDAILKLFKLGKQNNRS